MAPQGARERIDTDILVVGAGPSGLAAAIRLRQRHPELSVTVIEKSAAIGGHILSGAVMDPTGLDALLPDWRLEGAPTGPEVTRDTYHYLTASGDFAVPQFLLPPQMRTRGAMIVSLGALCRWLAERATALGVDIYPATAAVDLLDAENGAVGGVITGDLGRGRDGREKPGFAAGIALGARYTLIAEGARGSLAREATARFGLDAGRSPQTYGLGIKEIWRIAPERHETGRVDHYLGFPLDNSTGGGGFAYHAGENRLYLGLVVHLDYRDPTLSPFDEFQRFKTHPSIAPLLEGAEREAYGARVLATGGLQALPQLAFPGGALIGCAAGFMNAARLKAIHNAILSGIAAADAAGEAVEAGRAHDLIAELEPKVLATGIGAELARVRNTKPLWSRFGTLFGAALAGLDMWLIALLRLSPFGTLRWKKSDRERLRPIADVTPHRYERPDGITRFDRAASVHLAGLVHVDDQPVHLRLGNPGIPVTETLPRYGEPAPLYCPAGVYELSEEAGSPVFRIHPANCVHCKTCDIKDPAANITWVPPEAGSGPDYALM